MCKTVVLVVLDACRSDYINEIDMPFLYGLSKKGKYYKSLVPSYGFCERTEILTGLSSDESEYFTALKFCPEESPYKNTRLLFKLLTRVIKPLPYIYHRIFKRLVWEIVSRKGDSFPLLNLDWGSLSYFALSEDGKDNMIDVHQSSLKVLSKNLDLAFDETQFTSLNKKQNGNDNSRLNILSSKKFNKGLHLFYYGRTDELGHKLGPDSIEFRKELKNIDNELQTSFNAANANNSDLQWVFVGDHGMSTVNYKINIFDGIYTNLYDFKEGVDYLLFADSTLFRFWILNSSKKSKIESALFEFFNKPEIKKHGSFFVGSPYGISGDRRYGDYRWQCERGVLISPDNFNPTAKNLKGMHGYIPNHPDTFGMGILFGSHFVTEFVDSAHLTSIYGDIKRVLNES